MTFKKCLKAHLKRGIPSDDLEDELVPTEFQEACSCWKNVISNADLSNEQKLEINSELCEFLSKYLSANFAPENLPASKQILANLKDIYSHSVKVTAFEFDDCNIPIINVEAEFFVDFKSDLSQSDLLLWEAKQDDPLAWCVNFWWSFDDIDEDDWEGYLDTNDGVDLAIVE